MINMVSLSKLSNKKFKKKSKFKTACHRKRLHYLNCHLIKLTSRRPLLEKFKLWLAKKAKKTDLTEWSTYFLTEEIK